MALATAIGLGLAAAGSVISSSSANSAAGKAADTSLAVAEKNNALARDIYGKNQNALSPFMERGNVAGDQVNALLGIGTGGDTVDWNKYITSDQAAMQDYRQNWSGAPGSLGNMSLDEYAQFHYSNDLAYKRGQRTGNDGQTYAGADANYGGYDLSKYTTTGADRAAQAGQAFDTYKNSTGYQFRLGEGMNALNSGYAGRGVVQSGAAMKGALEYGQNFASGEFGNYLGYLSNQQGAGLSGASALAGVGQNYVSNVSSNNNAAGTAAANAILAKGANNPFGNALGMVGGGLYGYGR